MSKNPSLDADNPLAALVAELDDLNEIEVAPKPSKATTPDAPEEALEPKLKTAPRSEPQTENRSLTQREERTAEVASRPNPIDLQSRAVAAFEKKSGSKQTPSDHPASAKRPMTRSSTQNFDDQIDIPTRAGAASAVSASTTRTSQPPSKAAPRERRNMRGLMAGAAALLAVVGTGYVYMQGAQPASSEIVVYAAPVFDDEIETSTNAIKNIEPASVVSPTAVTAVFVPNETQEPAIDEPTKSDQELDDLPTTVAAVAPPPVPLPIAPVTKPQPFGFDEKFSAEFPELEGQSLLDLATGVPTFAPADIVPSSQWEDVSCGGCHTFDQANLCEQGAYYFNHDKGRIARIQHPYGGGFKTKLMQWAEGGCL